ncbi:hypothetical protein I5907_11635 [Panacibacter sp. DH6]|uniref:Uncharacterized protein n=1 Tax=Panacibacter microcysteis TaxID=2793269 RepID=A0A931E663_9BACT|nr:hypothetical protein [Panacibacter microcysteis]MBG9376892.1 hypothetical protein [Panacibacter microcysteis]
MKINFLLFFYFINCTVSQSSQTTNGLKVYSVGEIRLVDKDNNTYAIYSKDNKTYIPVNLDTNFMKNKLKVIFEGTIDTSKLKNVRLAGLPIWIDKIKAQ